MTASLVAASCCWTAGTGMRPPQFLQTAVRPRSQSANSHSRPHPGQLTRITEPVSTRIRVRHMAVADGGLRSAVGVSTLCLLERRPVQAQLPDRRPKRTLFEIAAAVVRQ